MDLSRLAERRAQHPDSSILPAESDGWAEPFPPVGLKPRATGQAEKSIGGARIPAERPPAALTAREERVKRILLKELSELGRKFNGCKGLTYAEKQRLEKRLDVAYLDGEIARMERSLDRTSRFKPWVLGLCAAAGIFLAWSVFVQDWQHLTGLLTLPFVAASFLVNEKALRRKLFIYEALRALSDADELDVILSKAAADADRLIEQIVSRELDAETRFGPASRLPSR